jgi:tetratricopeptide (TPR) repeat protein
MTTPANHQQLFDEAFRHHQAGRLAEAEPLYVRLLSLDPTHADACHLLGLIAYHTGRNDAAIGLIGKAIGIKSGVALYHANLGLALTRAGLLDQAVVACSNAVVLDPASPNARVNLGIALMDVGRTSDAIASYHAAIRLKPDAAEAHYNLGVALQEAGRLDEAIGAYDAAIRIRPEFGFAHYNRGMVLARQRRLDDAVAAYRAAILHLPRYAEAHTNLGAALRELGRLDEAIAACRAAIDIRPGYAEAHSNLGQLFFELGQFDLALASYHSAIGIEPDLAEVHHNESFIHLLRGDFATGWEKYEWRWRRAAAKRTDVFSQPRWDGQDISGKTILLHAEQGLGDTIQFCRYAALVAARGARVILQVPRHLVRLLSGLGGVSVLVAAGDPLPAFDVHCPLMSLPRLFGSTAATFPAPIPYLKAEPGLQEQWAGRLGSAGFKIGITWQGNPAAPAERGRSTPLACFAPLARIPGVRLISLQKVYGLAQLQHLPAGMQVETLGDDFDSGADAFVDTAAVMMNLDLIITVDTAIGHLAGALGCPVWLAIQAVPHWIWMLERTDSPWYPSARLFRQSGRGNWSEVFGRMAEVLMEQGVAGE